MNETPATRAVSAALLTLLACGGCLYFLISGSLGPRLGSLPVPALLAIGLCVSLFLHWFFVGLAARRLGRSAAGWVALAVLGFPIASIVALVLHYWLEAERSAAAGARQ